MKDRSSLRQGFLVSQPAVPGSEKEGKMTVGSGQKLLELFPKRNQDSSFWKMFEEYLLLKAEWYSNRCFLKWKASITKQGFILFQLAPSTLRTDEIGSGLLLTPSTEDYKSDGPSVMNQWTEARKHGKRPATSAQRLRNQTGHETGLKLQPNFVEWMMGYPSNWTDLNSPKQGIESKD